MNALGIPLVWCAVQVTLLSLLATGLYLVVRRLRPAAAAPVVLTGMMIVILLSLLAPSPWPRWAIHTVAQPRDEAGQASPGAALNEPLGPARPGLRIFLPPWTAGQRVQAVGADTASSKTMSASLAILWQAMVAELSDPPTAATTGGRHWPAVAALLLLAAMACGLGWLGLGVLAVRRQRLRSRPLLDGSLLELVDALRMELGCQRTVEARQADDLVTAATIGWRRPIVLLPADWTAWTAQQRRAVLAHEIAHARSHDFLALLLGQFGLVLHFYHPLVHWLMGRLRLEQELAADAAAAGVCGGQRQYLVTIAELALRRQHGPLLWPAHAFLPTRTTFLRRIAMLRDSKLRRDRLSPAARLATVGAMLLCGLLVAGVRGPSVSIAAPGADAEKPAAADHFIDTTFMIEKASMFVAMRPAAVFARPELAVLAKLLEQSGNMVPKGTHLADFRQITVIGPEAGLPTRLREIVVIEWVKPAAAKYLAELATGQKFTVKQCHGKTMYVNPSSREAVLAYDDYTLVSAGSEQAIGVYLAGKLGVLPQWLPARAWESLRADHFVIAAPTAMLRREIKPMLEHSPLMVQAAFLPISSLWEDANWLAGGARLDGKLTIHAWAAAKDADSSARLCRTAEALKTLTESFVKNFHVPSAGDLPSQRNLVSALLAEAERLVDNMKLQQEGNDLQLQTADEWDKARLGALMSAIAAAMKRADASTKTGMMALVEDFFHHNYRDLTSRETIQWGEIAKTEEGNFSIRYKYRARFWNGEPTIMNQVFTYTPQGQFVSVNDAEKRPPLSPARVYQVHKKVSDFPNREDLTTPEAAYASINRAYAAEGDAAWPRLSVPSLAAWLRAGEQKLRLSVPALAGPAQDGEKKPLPKPAADRLLGAEILEVHVWDGIHAVVIAREEVFGPQGSDMDMRWLTRVQGRWLNEGNDSRRTLEAARRKIEESRSH
jgi:beta-lactamase regulating signal transducer with metallopeptidase domain